MWVWGRSLAEWVGQGGNLDHNSHATQVGTDVHLAFPKFIYIKKNPDIFGVSATC